MITSSTDICNLALDLLSAGNITDAEIPTTPTEELCARWYPQVRRKMLREHPWNFAIRRVILAADATDPDFGYPAQFTLPADFIRFLYLSTDLTTGSEVVMPSNEYQVEGGKILLSSTYGDATQARLVYVADVDTVSSMDPMFIDLLAHELALTLAYKVTETNTNVERIAELQQKRAAMAKSIDGQERPPILITRSRSLSARRGGYGSRNDRFIF